MNPHLKSINHRQSTLYPRLCIFVLFLVAASASFSGYYQKWHFAEADMPGDDIRASFETMVDGAAYRPYVYRQLLPSAANWLDHIVPQSTKDWLYTHQGSGAEAWLYAISTSPTASNPVYFFRYLVLYAATFLFTLLAVYAMYLVCRAAGLPPPASVFAPVIVILLVPYIESTGGFFYDYPELAFFALVVFIALRFPWVWLIPLAALGTWNKESFLLFIPTLYPLIRLRTSRPRALLAVAVLGLVCAAVYLPLRLHYASNPGGIVELQALNQLRFFLHPAALLFQTDETYGLRLPSAFTLLPLALLVWTVCRAWHRLPRPIQRHAQIAAAINVPLYLFFCSPGELRDLSLLYILFLLALAANLNRWIESPPQTTPQKTIP